MKQAILAAALFGSASAFCPNSCSGNGECGENDKCECYDKYEGADCSLRQCTYGISWIAGTEGELASMSVPNYMSHSSKAYAVSADGSAGPVQGLHAYAECSDKGICDHVTGQCRCFAGYTGAGCRRSECPNSCHGHGRCVLDAEVYQTNSEIYQPTDQMYGNDMLLFAQKQYWNNMKTTQCICDAGYTGYDCSTRMCPKGDDPSSGCTTELKYSDVQVVSLSLTNDLDATEPFNVEQYFTLKYTDSFNNEYETKPLSYYDDASTVQKALMGLPNFVIPNLEVVKIFPEDTLMTTGGAEAIQDRCSTFYHETFQDVTCHSDLECSAKFGLPTLGAYTDAFAIAATKVDTLTDITNDHSAADDGAGNLADAAKSKFSGDITIGQVAGKGQSAVFCDMSASYVASTADGRSTHGMCIETQENCAFRDGITEFEAGAKDVFNQDQVGACGDSFEPDGIYMTLMREAAQAASGLVKDSFEPDGIYMTLMREA